MAQNPYQAPEAALDTATGTPEALQEPRRVGAGRGAAWIGRAFDLFRAHWLLWLGMIVVMGLILMALALVPVLNLAGSVIMPVFIGGVMLAASQADTAGSTPFGTLFRGFRDHFIQLIGVGVMSLLGLLAYMAFAFGILFGTGLWPAMQGGEVDPAMAENMATTMPLAILGGMALTIPFVMATWFAPALVTIHRTDLLAALRMSFIACLRNILPFLVYGLVFLVLFLGLGILLMLLGLASPILAGVGYFAVLLVLGPVVLLTQYTAHRDIYLAPEPA